MAGFGICVLAYMAGLGRLARRSIIKIPNLPLTPLKGQFETLESVPRIISPCQASLGRINMIEIVMWLKATGQK